MMVRINGQVRALRIQDFDSQCEATSKASQENPKGLFAMLCIDEDGKEWVRYEVPDEEQTPEDFAEMHTMGAIYFKNGRQVE